ncbi:MAG TPA: hypothetical protein VNI52_03085 [Sphingobacteriaceae bacterium]|nr:hypothetical protein [Sphingobacteriaceae bacterium]
MAEIKYTVAGDDSDLQRMFKEITEKSRTTKTLIEKDLQQIQQKQVKLEVNYGDRSTIPGGSVAGEHAQRGAAANEAFARSAKSATIASTEQGLATVKTTTALISQQKTIDQLSIRMQAYQNIVRSSSDPKVISNYNKKIEDTQIQITRLGNQGRSGFDKMGAAIKPNIGLAGKMMGGLKGLTAFLPGIGIATAIAFVAEPVLKFIASLGLFEKKIDSVLELKKRLSEASVKGNQDAQGEITQLKLLYTNAKNTNLPLEKRKNLYKELQSQYPSYFKNISFEQIATKQASNAYNGLSASIIATARARAYGDKITENTSRKIANDAKIKDLEAQNLKNQIASVRAKELDQASVGTSTFAMPSLGNVITATGVITASKKIADTQRSINNLKTDNNLLNAQNLKFEGAITTEIGAGAQVGKDRFKDDEKGFAKAESARISALARQTDMYQKVADIQNEYARKSLSDEESEIKAIKDKFKKITDEVKAFNANPKNKFKVDGSSLPDAEKAAISELKYRNETDTLKKSLDKQRSLYEDYEEYKSSRGADEAKKRYSTELDLGKTFLQRLQEEQALLMAQGSVSGYDGKAQERLTVIGDLLESETELTKKNMDQAFTLAMNHEQKLIAIRQKYADAAKFLGINITESQKKELINQMDDEISSANDIAFQKSEIYKRLAKDTVLYSKETLKAEIKAAESLLKDADLPDALRAQIESQLSNLKSKLNIGVDDSNMAALEEQKRVIEQALLNPLIAGTQAAEEYKKKLIEIQSQINGIDAKVFTEMFSGDAADVAKNISSTGDALSGSFMELSSALEGVNDGLAYTLGSIGQLIKVGSDAAGSFASFASGDIIGGVTKAISAVAGLFTMGKKVKEMNAKARAEVQKFYTEAINGEIEYASLVRSGDRESASSQAKRLESLKNEHNLLKQQSSEIDKQYKSLLAQIQKEEYVLSQTYQHGTLFRKAKTDAQMGSLSGLNYDEIEKLYTSGKLTDGAKALFEQLRKLKDEGADVNKALADIADRAQQMFTGTTSDAITDSLLSMFREGKTGASELADFFKQTMDEAAISIFKNKFLASQMDGFYKEFADKSQSDEVLTENEIAILKEKFKGLTDEAGKRFEELKKITGSDLKGGSSAGASSSTLRGEITAMTETTGTALVGGFNGMRIQLAQSLEVHRSQLAINQQCFAISQQTLSTALAIERNTKITADKATEYLPYLSEISRNTKDTSATALRAAGKYGY